MARFVAVIPPLFILSAFQLSGGNPGSPSEEFVGPLTGWQDVTAAPCNATGNGSTNDAPAIQTCINNLSSSHPVIWFPAHTYKVSDITATGTASGSSTALTIGGATGTIVSGMSVSCTNVPAGDWVASIVGNNVTLGQATTGAVSGTCTFGLDIRAMDSVSLIGADPSTTKWQWAGSSGGTMMLLDGNQYSHVNRITFDGNSTAAILLYQAKLTGTGFFDTGNEYSDDVFQNATEAFNCGGAASGCAETTMLRNKFTSLSTGIEMANANALDMWVWYSTFSNVTNGITSTSGNWGCYYNVFTHSPQATSGADLSSSNDQNFSMVGCYSSGGNRFYVSGGNATANPIFLLGNTIVSPNSTPVVRNDTVGPSVYIDNFLQSSGSQPYFTQSHSDFGSGVLSYQNTFTSGTAGCGASNVVNLSISSTPPSISTCTTVGDVVNGSATTPAQPTLPGTPANYGRTVSEVSGVSGLASAITAACGTSGSPIVGPKNVVHLQQSGSPYNISSTLTIPASDCQIIGDGRATTLTWTGSANGQLMQLTGPSKVTLRNFGLSLGKAAGGIVVTNADQSGARVFGQSLYFPGPTSAGNAGFGIYSDSLDNTLVEMHNFTKISATNTGSIGVKVTGGTSAQAGTWLGGATNIWAALTAVNDTSYSTSLAGHLIVNGSFNDTGGGGGLNWASVTGQYGGVTLAGNTIGMTNTAAVSYLAANNWQGALAFLANLQNPNTSRTGGTQSTGYVTFSGTGTGAYDLTSANLFYSTGSWANTTDSGTPNDNYWLLSNAVCDMSVACASTWNVITDANNIAITQPNLANALNQISNARPLVIRNSLSGGVTDVQLYAVACDSPGNATNNAACLHVQH